MAPLIDDVPMLEPPSNESEPRPARDARWSALVLWAALAFLAQELNVEVGKWVELPPPGTPLGHAVSIVWTLVVLALLVQGALAGARLARPAWQLVGVGAVAAGPVLVQVAGIYLSDGSAPSAALPAVVTPIAVNFLGPLGLTLVGVGLARGVRHANLLLVAAAAAMFFDVVIVSAGTVAALRERAPEAIAQASLGAGTAAAPDELGPEPLSRVSIGPADVLFLAFFLGAVVRLRLAERATSIWLMALLGVGIVAVEVGSIALPALLPMGLAVVSANLSHARFTPAERRALVAGAALAVLIGAMIVIGAGWWL